MAYVPFLRSRAQAVLMPAVYQLVPGSMIAKLWFNTLFPPDVNSEVFARMYALLALMQPHVRVSYMMHVPFIVSADRTWGPCRILLQKTTHTQTSWSSPLR